jgi:hypothetical protein
MGNVTISTSETNIYWPSDWLVDGSGATYEVMGCPKLTIDETVSFSVVAIAFDIDNAKWQVIVGGEGEEATVVMESTNYKDVATYLLEYMQKTRQWWDDQTAINEEAERE